MLVAAAKGQPDAEWSESWGIPSLTRREEWTPADPQPQVEDRFPLTPTGYCQCASTEFPGREHAKSTGWVASGTEGLEALLCEACMGNPGCRVSVGYPAEPNEIG